MRQPAATWCLSADGTQIDKNAALQILGCDEWPVTLENCRNNRTNRPFFPQLSKECKDTILQGRYQLNGEPIILDWNNSILSGQHRLMGLCWAIEEWQKDPSRYKCWKVSPYIETLLVTGVNPKCASTIGVGRTQNRADALYRGEYFQEYNASTRSKLAKLASYALAAFWQRTKLVEVSRINRQPHEVTLTFLDNHPRFVQVIKRIWNLENGEGPHGRLLSEVMPLGLAAALLYLMACSSSNRRKYNSTEANLKWDLYTKACQYWSDIAKNSKSRVRIALQRLPEGGITFRRELQAITAIKGWLDYVENKKGSLAVDVAINEYETPVVVECAYCGGLDIPST